MILPNVSHCIDQNDVHYNPLPACITVDITVPEENNNNLMWFLWDGTQSSDSVYQNFTTSNIKFVEIDDVKIKQENVVVFQDTNSKINYYGVQISAGNHIVKYYLNDETLFNYFMAASTPWYWDGELNTFPIMWNINTITFPSTIKILTGEYSLSRFERNQLNINMMNLEVIQGRYVFGCSFYDFPQEEKDYLVSICTDKEWGPAYCK